MATLQRLGNSLDSTTTTLLDSIINSTKVDGNTPLLVYTWQDGLKDAVGNFTDQHSQAKKIGTEIGFELPQVAEGFVKSGVKTAKETGALALDIISAEAILKGDLSPSSSLGQSLEKNGAKQTGINVYDGIKSIPSKIEQTAAGGDSITAAEYIFDTILLLDGSIALGKAGINFTKWGAGKLDNVLEAANSANGAAVTARGTVKGSVFQDVNQSAKIGASNEPTLIADRVAAKAAAEGRAFPNGTVANSHAEIGVIQQAYNSGKTQGAKMSMTVSGKDVCGYCKGDIAAAADAAGLKSLTVQAVDNMTGLPKTYYWQPGMKSIKEKP